MPFDYGMTDVFFFSSRRRHTRSLCDWSSDVCSSDLDIPITIMARAEASLEVIGKNAPLPDVKPFLDSSVRERWNDYGIGLLLQGDLKGAEAAFKIGRASCRKECRSRWSADN